MLKSEAVNGNDLWAHYANSCILPAFLIVFGLIDCSLSLLLVFILRCLFLLYYLGRLMTCRSTIALILLYYFLLYSGVNFRLVALV